MNETLKLRVVPMKLAKLIPHPRNPRRHPDPGTPEWAALKASLEHDYFDPIVINDGTTEPTLRNVLVSGHLRTKVLLECGVKTADCVLVDYDGPTHVARMIAANRQTGEWDDKALQAIMAECKAPALAGYTDDQIKEILAGSQTADSTVDAEPQMSRADELQKVWKTEPGQLWKLGEHKLLCGDSTKAEDVARVIGGEKAQAVLTDPPYGQNQYGVPGDSPKDMLRIVPAACALFPTENAVSVLFQSPRTFLVALDAMRSSGWTFNRCLWMYKQAQCVKPWRGWLLKSEAILLFSKGEPTWNECNPYSHDCYMMAELSGELAPDSGWHGSVKPIKVVLDICQRISVQSGIIYDPFLGSGTTLIACERLGRRCRAIEISPAYCAVTLQRWADSVGKTPTLVTNA